MNPAKKKPVRPHWKAIAKQFEGEVLEAHMHLRAAQDFQALDRQNADLAMAECNIAKQEITRLSGTLAQMRRTVRWLWLVAIAEAALLVILLAR